MDFFCAMGLRQQPTSSFEGSSCRNPEIASTFSWEKLVLNYRSCSFLLCNHNDLRFNTPAYLQNRQRKLPTTYLQTTYIPTINSTYMGGNLDMSCTYLIYIWVHSKLLIIFSYLFQKNLYFEELQKLQNTSTTLKYCLVPLPILYYFEV